MLKYELVITPRAIKEIQNAVDFYNSRQRGLGRRFYMDIKRQLSAIAKNPFSRAIRYNDIRLAVLDKFPYAAHYNIADDFVIVLGIISMHMDPETSWVTA